MTLTQAERSARWRAAHPEKARAEEKARRMAETPAQRQQRLARMYRYRARNPDRMAADTAAQSSNRRARRRGLTDRITSDDVLDMWRRQPACLACGVGRGVDHVIRMADGGANLLRNLQNLCKPCNDEKDAARRRLTDDERRARQRGYNRAYYLSHRATASAD